MDAEYEGRQVVGIDLHRRRSVIVRMSEAGEKLETVRIDNDPIALSLEIAKAGPIRRWSSKQPTAGTGRSTCWPVLASGCIWRIRWAWKGSSTGG